MNGDILPEPEISGYQFLTNVNPRLPFSPGRREREFSNKKGQPYTDAEIAQHYASQLGIPIDQILVRRATGAIFLRTVYRKIQSENK